MDPKPPGRPVRRFRGGCAHHVLPHPASHPIPRVPFRPRIERLAGEIVRQCREKGVSGSYREITALTPPGDAAMDREVLPALRMELCRQGHRTLRAIMPPERYDEWARKDLEDMKKRGVSEGEIEEIMRGWERDAREKTADLIIDEASWTWLDAKSGTVRLTLRLSPRGKPKSIEASVEFTHPARERAFLERAADDRGRLDAVLVLAALSLVLWMVGNAWLAKRLGQMEENLPAAMERLEGHLRAGAYKAASVLADEYLAAFDRNTDLVGFRERLVHVTRGDPRRAEGAYLRYLNLKARLSVGGELNEQDVRDVEGLNRFLDLPEINAFQASIEAYLKRRRLLQVAEGIEASVTRHLEEGDLRTAREKAEELRRLRMKIGGGTGEGFSVEIGGSEVSLLEGKVDAPAEAEQAVRDSIGEAREAWRDAQAAMERGDPAEAVERLKRLLQLDSDHVEGAGLLRRLKKAAGEYVLTLAPHKVGHEVRLFAKDVLRAARPDKEIPDIPLSDTRVSRDRHLKISILEDGVVAEDEGSSNGTYVRGAKITKVRLGDGDVVDLGRGVRFVTHLFPAAARPGSGAPAGRTADPEAFRTGGGEGAVGALVLEEVGGEEVQYASVLSATRLNCGPAGIVFEKEGECVLRRVEGGGGFFVLQTPRSSQVLIPGETLEYKGVRYTVST